MSLRFIRKDDPSVHRVQGLDLSGSRGRPVRFTGSTRQVSLKSVSEKSSSSASAAQASSRLRSMIRQAYILIS